MMEFILSHVEKGVMTLTLNRPERLNSFNDEMHAQLEGNMHDTVMLLGMLGWDKYDGKVEFITELFPSSGTGQVNAVFPLQ